MGRLLRIAIALVLPVVAGVGAYLLYRGLALPRHFGHLLPEDVVAYVRLKDVGTLEKRLVQEGDLRDHASVQEALDEALEGWLEEAERAKDGPRLEAETLEDLIESFGSVHLAILPPAGRGEDDVPGFVVFLEISDPDALERAAKEMGEGASKTRLSGREAYDLAKSFQPGVVAVLLEDVVVLGKEDDVRDVIRAEESSIEHPLSEKEEFQAALAECGDQGDLFVYANLESVREIAAREIDQEETWVPEWVSVEEASRLRAEAAEEKRAKKKALSAWEEFGFVAASVGVDGRIAVHVHAAPGEEIPEFLVRKGRERELLERIPASAPLVWVMGYEGGKETRRSFASWLAEKTGKGVRVEDLPVEVPVANQLLHGLEELEDEVVVMAEDFWIAAIPVRHELAFVVAPDDRGRWGAVVAFDWQDRRQVETLFRKLVDAPERSSLPWRTKEHHGLEIRYLDLAELARREGKVELPEGFEHLQLEVGYAIGETYAFAGSVGLLCELHHPTGEVVADDVDYEGLAEDNAFFGTLRIGRWVHGPRSDFEPLARIQHLLGRQIPPTAQYSATMVTTPERITLLARLPLTSLASWLALDPQVREELETNPSPGEPGPR